MPFTPDSDLELLFLEELIPQQIKAQLPPELHVRPSHPHFLIYPYPYPTRARRFAR